jgi:hypothetical protein
MSWMQTCCNAHSRCKFIPSSDPATPQGNPHTDLPTRVLYVGTSDSEVRLFISKGAKGKYATLSHRWGNRETTACTTTANLDNRTSGIPLDSLSQMFRDAISVTRRLGLSYCGLILCVSCKTAVRTGSESQLPWATSMDVPKSRSRL